MRAQVRLALLLGLASVVAAPPAVRSAELPAQAGERLEVDLYSGGAIRVRGWDRNLVTLEPMVPGKDGEQPFEMSRRGGGIRVTPRARGGGPAELGGAILRVPERFDLDLSTAGGSIEIEAVDGELRCRTMGGDLVLARLSGTIDAETLGGTIRLRDSTVDGELTTMGGSVTVASVEGTVDAATGGGDVQYTDVVAGGRDCREVRISTQGGDVRAPVSPCGLDVRTLGGNIHVPQVADHVRAVTSGGDISIDAIDGWAHVMTEGGDVDVRITGDPARSGKDVRLDSRGGNITLRFPRGLSADFHVTLAHARGAVRERAIRSDMPLEVRESVTRGAQAGPPQRLLTGRASVAGGKNRIKIATYDGDIRLIQE